MTRFARAHGSKASNERNPEDATSWSEMKKQLMESQNRSEKEKFENMRKKNYENFLQEQKEKSVVPTWYEFDDEPNTSKADAVVKKSDKSTKKHKQTPETSESQKTKSKKSKIVQDPIEEENESPSEAESDSEIDVDDEELDKWCEDLKDEESTNRYNELTSQLEDIFKTLKAKKLRSNEKVVENSNQKQLKKKNLQNGFFEETIVISDEQKKLKKKELKKQKKNKSRDETNEEIINEVTENKVKQNKKKNKLNNEESSVDVLERNIKKNKNKSKNEDVTEEIAESDVTKKKKNKSKNKGVADEVINEVQNQDNNTTSEKKSKKKKRKMTKDTQTNGVQDEDETPQKKMKLPNDTKTKQKNKNSKQDTAAKSFERRKPQQQETIKIVINGEQLEIVQFDGFPILIKDADRLRDLRKNLISKGIPRNEVERTMKLERRKAEKSLARIKKKLCLHCRKSGHNLNECPDLDKECETTGIPSSGICYKCGSTEHSHFACKVVKTQDFKFAQCFICKDQGHISRQCPDNPRGIYPKGGACRECGDVTHLKKDCPKIVQEREDKSIKLDTMDMENIEDISRRQPKPITNSSKIKHVRF